MTFTELQNKVLFKEKFMADQGNNFLNSHFTIHCKKFTTDIMVKWTRMVHFARFHCFCEFNY